MKKIISFYAFFLITIMSNNLLYSQYETLKVIPVLPERITVGDMCYTTDYKGLKYFMNDIEYDDPELFEVLSPEFNRLTIKRNTGIACWITSGIIGTTFIVSGISSVANADIDLDDVNSKPSMGNYELVFAGLGIYAIGGLFGYIFYPDKNDFFRFINLHNKYSPDNKMNWEIGLNMNPNEIFKLTINY